jgi:predicted amidohydrolase YtcJ
LLLPSFADPAADLGRHHRAAYSAARSVFPTGNALAAFSGELQLGDVERGKYADMSACSRSIRPMSLPTKVLTTMVGGKSHMSPRMGPGH